MKIKILILLLIGVVETMFSTVSDKTSIKNPAVVTVYVHGTLFHLRNIFAKIPVAAELTYVPDGLTLVKTLSEKTLPHELALEFCKKDSKRFCLDDFYAFGWSGKLSFKERQKTGKLLAESLVDLSKKYEQKDGIKPILRVVTFSHGGNVALNMAPFLSSEVTIELILIGCPIQPDTESFALSNCFSKIYTIFSLKDFIQVVDPINVCKNIKRQVTKKTTSKKVLSSRFLSYDHDKIKQVCVLVNEKHIGHLQLFHLFNKHVPDVLAKLDASSGITGTNILMMNIKDPYFRSFYGINVIDVVKGKEYKKIKDKSE